MEGKGCNYLRRRSEKTHPTILTQVSMVGGTVQRVGRPPTVYRSMTPFSLVRGDKAKGNPRFQGFAGNRFGQRSFATMVVYRHAT